MTAGVRVSFGLVKDEVSAALKKQETAYKASRRAIGEVTGSYKQLEREAVRALKRTSDEQVKINRLQVGLNRLVKAGVISQAAANRTLKETKEQMMAAEGRLPDSVVACIGGGSNAMGLFHPFLDDPDVAIYGVEAGGDGRSVAGLSSTAGMRR